MELRRAVAGAGDPEGAQQAVLDLEVAPLLADPQAGLAGRRDIEAAEEQRAHAGVGDRVVLEEELTAPVEPQRDLAPEPLEGVGIEGRHRGRECTRTAAVCTPLEFGDNPRP
ncbi:hypothetical protein [Nannocystis pusilla]|uniref:hypothetical protein n=1 Tax=Nannocystis pusilla TaxID=889268 RepID=UPI003B798C88